MLGAGVMEQRAVIHSRVNEATDNYTNEMLNRKIMIDTRQSPPELKGPIINKFCCC